jgi:hypothetical protein
MNQPTNLTQMVNAQSPQTTAEQGVIYVANPKIWNVSEVTIDKLYNLRSNVYAKGVAKKHRNLILSKAPEIIIYKPNNDIDEKLQTHITRMMEAADVDYVSKIGNAVDEAFFSGIGIFNWVWSKGVEGYPANELVLAKLKYLPSHSFNKSPPVVTGTGAKRISSRLLPGIIINDKGEIEFWQNDGISMQPTPLNTKGLIWIKDPGSPELEGDAIIKPIAPVIEMLSFTWNSQMQYVNRAGAPPLFIKITNPREANTQNNNLSDEEYAQIILQNWGKDNQYPLRDNYEPIFPNFGSSQPITEIINALHYLMLDYVSPSSMVHKSEGTLIGGSSQSEMELVQAYIEGFHRWLEAGFSRIVQYYLDQNKYVGYKGVVSIPSLSIDRSELKLAQAELGATFQVISPNEVRALIDHEGLADDELQAIKDSWGAAAPAPAMGFGFKGGGSPDGDNFPPVDEADYEGCGHDHHGDDKYAAFRLANPKLRTSIEKRAYFALEKSLELLGEDLSHALKEMPFSQGGSGSGNFGHAGRPGERGGSTPGGGSSETGSAAHRINSAFHKLPTSQKIRVWTNAVMREDPLHEHEIVIKNGVIISASSGDETGIITPYRVLKELKGATLVHMHPAMTTFDVNKYIPEPIFIGGSFSGSDIMYAVNHDLGEMAAFDEEYYYTISPKPGKSWNDPAVNRLMETYSKSSVTIRETVFANIPNNPTRENTPPEELKRINDFFHLSLINAMNVSGASQVLDYKRQSRIKDKKEDVVCHLNALESEFTVLENKDEENGYLDDSEHYALFRRLFGIPEPEKPLSHGGSGSGNYGHGGRPGEVGGSTPGGETTTVPKADKVRSINDLRRIADVSLPKDNTKYEYFYHAVRYYSDIDKIEKEGIKTGGGGRLYGSKDEIRDLGSGFVIFRAPTGQMEEGIDQVEAKLAYREWSSKTPIPPEDIVRIVREIPMKGTQHTIREDELAQYVIDHPVDHDDISDLPEVYQRWFDLSESFTHGGSGSGNYGHGGRPGEVGGSTPGGGSGDTTTTHNMKVAKAKASYKPVTSAKHRKATTSEIKLAKEIGGKREPDQSPFDVIKGKNAIEVKTIIEGETGKITMHGPSLKAKKEQAAENGWKPHTVVFDSRDGKIYYKEGVGGYRITAMNLTNMDELRKRFA